MNAVKVLLYCPDPMFLFVSSLCEPHLAKECLQKLRSNSWFSLEHNKKPFVPALKGLEIPTAELLLQLQSTSSS